MAVKLAENDTSCSNARQSRPSKALEHAGGVDTARVRDRGVRDPAGHERGNSRQGENQRSPPERHVSPHSSSNPLVRLPRRKPRTKQENAQRRGSAGGSRNPAARVASLTFGERPAPSLRTGCSRTRVPRARGPTAPPLQAGTPTHPCRRRPGSASPNERIPVRCGSNRTRPQEGHIDDGPSCDLPLAGRLNRARRCPTVGRWPRSGLSESER